MKKSFAISALVMIAIALIASPSFAQQEEKKDPCPVHDDSSSVPGVEKLAAEERDLYDELWANFGEAGNIAPPLTFEVFSIVVVLSDFSDALSDADKTALDDAGKNYLRAMKLANQIFPELADPAIVKDQNKVKLVRELTAKLKEVSVSVRDWVASWAKRLNLPDLGIVPYTPPRYVRWQKEVAEEK